MKYSCFCLFSNNRQDLFSRMIPILRCFQTWAFTFRFFWLTQTFQIWKGKWSRSLRNNNAHVFSREGVNQTFCQQLHLLSVLLNNSQIGMICETKGCGGVGEGSLGVGNGVVNDLISKCIVRLEKRSLVSKVNSHNSTHDSSKFALSRTSRMICSGVLPSRTRGTSRFNL